jgi:hypothetical protein
MWKSVGEQRGQTSRSAACIDDGFISGELEGGKNSFSPLELRFGYGVV